MSGVTFHQRKFWLFFLVIPLLCLFLKPWLYLSMMKWLRTLPEHSYTDKRMEEIQIKSDEDSAKQEGSTLWIRIFEAIKFSEQLVDHCSVECPWYVHHSYTKSLLHCDIIPQEKAVVVVFKHTLSVCPHTSIHPLLFNGVGWRHWLVVFRLIL